MKKLISLLATVSMLATTIGMFGTCASAAAGEGNDAVAKIIVDVQAPADYEGTITDVPPVDGYDAYLASYKVTNFDSNVQSLAYFTIKYIISEADKANIHTKSFTAPKTTGPAAQRAKNAVYASAVTPAGVSAEGIAMDLSSVDMYDPSMGGNGVYGLEDTTGTILTQIWYVKQGEQVTITYNKTAEKGNTALSASDYETGAVTEYWYDYLTLSQDALVLGGSAGYDFVEGTKYTVEADGINGVVWAGNEMKNVNSADNDYVATFTADGAEPKTRTLTNLPEATTFTFDAILRFKDNTVKSGLAFDVVEVAK